MYFLTALFYVGLSMESFSHKSDSWLNFVNTGKQRLKWEKLKVYMQFKLFIYKKNDLNDCPCF